MRNRENIAKQGRVFSSSAAEYSGLEVECFSKLGLEARPELIERVIVLAEQNVAAGRFPYAGLLEWNGKILAEAANAVALPNSKEDLPIFEPPQAHPELKLAGEAVRIAEEKFPGDHDAQLNFLKGITLYTSCEPCSMCSQALAGALVTKIVFSISHQDALLASGIATPPVASTDEVFQSYGLQVELAGPLETERALIAFKRAWDHARKIVSG